MAFDPGQRTYFVDDDRLRTFRVLTPIQRLQWVEQIAQFLRLARVARARTQHPAAAIPSSTR